MKAFKTLALTGVLALVGISASAIGVEKDSYHVGLSCNKDCRIQALRKELNEMPKNDLLYTQMTALVALSPKAFDVTSRVLIIEKLDEISRKLDHVAFD